MTGYLITDIARAIATYNGRSDAIHSDLKLASHIIDRLSPKYDFELLPETEAHRTKRAQDRQEEAFRNLGEMLGL